jgi:polysaccharide transporter, PST family
MENESIGRRVIKGGGISIIYHLVYLVIQLTQLIVLSRILTPEDFGIVGMAVAITGFIRLFQDMGFSNATIQRPSISQDLLSALFYINIIVGLVLMVFCWMAVPVASWIFKEDRVGEVILVMSLSIPMLSSRAQHRALMMRNMEFNRLNIVQIVSNLIGLVAACWCAVILNLGYWSIAVAQIVTSTVDMMMFWILSSWRPTKPQNYDGLKEAFNFGANITGSNILSWIWKQSDNLIVGARLGASELGYYTRAYSIFTLPMGIISGPIASAVIPGLSKLQHDSEKWLEVYGRAVRLLLFLGALMTIFLYINSDLLIYIFMGEGWTRSSEVFSVLSLSIIPAILWELARFEFLSLGRSDVMLKYSLIAGPLHVLMFWVGAGQGTLGVAWGLCIASWILTIPLIRMIIATSPITVREMILSIFPLVIPLVSILTLYVVVVNKTEGYQRIIESFGVMVSFILVFFISSSRISFWKNDFYFLNKFRSKVRGA